jgi:hypothetical protein
MVEKNQRLKDASSDCCSMIFAASLLLLNYFGQCVALKIVSTTASVAAADLMVRVHLRYDLRSGLRFDLRFVACVGV